MSITWCYRYKILKLDSSRKSISSDFKVGASENITSPEICLTDLMFKIQPGQFLLFKRHFICQECTVNAWIESRWSFEILQMELRKTSIQLRIEGNFGFRKFGTKFCNFLKYGMNLKSQAIVLIFRKIIQLNAVIILKSSNEYYWKIISKSCHKMDLYPAIVYRP